VRGASANKVIDKDAAAPLATNQPIDHENDKETTNQPICIPTSSVDRFRAYSLVLALV